MVERSCPTAAKENEKQRDAADKSRGVTRVVKKKPKVIERHFDDCGENLKGLGESFSFSRCEGFSSSSDEDDGIPLIQGDVGDYLPTYWFSHSILLLMTFSAE